MEATPCSLERNRTGSTTICCELWPGNTADVTTLIPVVERLRSRFHIGTVCIVADRGMIGKDTIKRLKSDPNLKYIFGEGVEKG